MKRTAAAALISVLAFGCSEDDPEPAEPTVVSFEASKSRVGPGERFLLEWVVEDADSVTITTLEGDLVVGGSEDAEGRAMAGPLLQDTTFTLRAEGPGGRTGASVLVQVDYPRPVISRFVAQPSVVLEGDPSFLFWETSNGTEVRIEDEAGGLVHVGADAIGSSTVTPSQSTTYVLTLTGPGGVDTATTSVIVRGAPPVIEAFEAEPDRIFEGDPTVLSWRTRGAELVRVLDDDGNVLVDTSSASASFIARPLVNTTYELIVRSATGEDRATVDVEVLVLEAPKIELLTASPEIVGVGLTTTLAWVMSGAERYRISANGALVLEQPTSGELANEPVTVTSTSTRFVVEVENRVGTASAEVTVIGHAAPQLQTFTVTPLVQASRGPVLIDWSVRSLATLDLLRDGAPVPGFTPIRASGAAIDAQGSLTVDVRDLARLEMVASSAGGAASGAQLTVVGVEESEPNDTPALATTLTGTIGRVRGRLDGPSDVDVYVLDVPDDGRVFARTLSGKDVCTLDTRLSLTSTDGVSILLTDDNDGVGACAQLDPDVDPEVSGLRAGFYYLVVQAGTSTSAGPYALEYESRKPICGDGRLEGTEQCDDGNQADADGCDSACTVEIAGVITPPSGVVSVTHPGGAGYVTVAVDVTSPGQRILARANDPNAGGCNAVDTALVLLDASFTLLGSRADGGQSGTAGTCAAFVVPPDTFAADLAVGRYYVQVRSENAASGAIEVVASVADPGCGNGIPEGRAGEQCDDGNLVSGDGCSATCRLEVSQFPEVEPNDSQATAFSTGLLGAGTATIQAANNPAGDDDVFSFVVPAGQTLSLSARTFTTSGMPMSCDSQLTDTRLYLEAAGVEATTPNSGELAFNDDIDNANNIWCSELSGLLLPGGAGGTTYFLRVQGWRDIQTTQYFLRVNLAP